MLSYCVILLMSLCLCDFSVQAEETLTVAVASSVLIPAQKLAVQFEKMQHIRVKLISGSTGLLYSQIMHGAPYAVFMAADDVTPEKLIRQRGLPASAVETYAIGSLYLCVRGGAPDLKHLSGRIAMAEPQVAPYGKAAEESLRASGVWAKVKADVIHTPNVMLAASYLQRGFVDAAFVASSAVSTSIKKRCEQVDESLHAPIRHRAVLLTSSAIGHAWFSFIRSPEMNMIWQQAGFNTEAR